MFKKCLVAFVATYVVVVLSGCAAAVAGGAVAGVSMMHDRRTTGTMIDDQTIAFKADNLISKMDETDNVHVSTVSYNNNVLLVGQVPSEKQRIKIESLVRDLDRVRQVYNEIEISAPTSTLTRSSDTWLGTKVRANLLWDKSVDGTRIKTHTEDGVVYLMGIVTKEEEATAVDLVRRIGGVKRVVKLFEYIPSPVTEEETLQMEVPEEEYNAS